MADTPGSERVAFAPVPSPDTGQGGALSPHAQSRSPAPADIVRRVQDKGFISYRGQKWTIAKAFAGYPVALRPTPIDGLLEVYFCHQKVAQINLATL